MSSTARLTGPASEMSGPQIITLGCRLNIAESEAIREIIGREVATDRMT